MIRVLVDENIPIPDAISGADIELRRCSGRDIKAADLLDTDALLVRSVTQVGRRLLSNTQVRFVGSATAGFDHLDIDYLNQADIGYYYAAGSNANSVVDYVLSCLAVLSVDPRERSLGIVGCGQVGGRLYRRMQHLNVQCSCYDPFLSSSDQPDLFDLDKVLRSDILCLHTPLTKSGPYPTENMIGYQQLMQLPEGAVVINAGRGGVINEEDLKRVVTHRPDMHLVMDVWQGEPHIDMEVLDLCEIATPHIAGYAAPAKLRGSQMVFEKMFEYFGIGGYKNLTVQPSSKESTADDSWNRAVLNVYDPRVDDALLRADRVRNFDQLRKNYPMRLEIADYVSESETLQKFGFSKADNPMDIS